MRLRIEYYDHNEAFAQLLPREGTVEDIPEASDSRHRWHLLRLDSPINYDGMHYTHFLVASRWHGKAIGDQEPTSVFVLLVPADSKPRAGFSYKQFMHVAWGMAHAL